MFTAKFGIEIEMTGITRAKAAEVAQALIGGETRGTEVIAPDGRRWAFKRDGSIRCQKKQGGRIVAADGDYSVELVSPILTYREDIDTLQELIRRLRKAGGFGNELCGVHVHCDGAPHTPRSILNFINIIASKNDLLYKALQIEPERMRYCKKMDAALVDKLNRRKPTTFAAIERIWYEGYRESAHGHFHSSRYHFCNLHSFFHGHRTVELRGFNTGKQLHAGVIRSYVVLALALNHQALTQKSASAKKPQVENEKFAMRTYLNRIGLIGDEFKNCREHLTQALSGDAAWRHGRP